MKETLNRYAVRIGHTAAWLVTGLVLQTGRASASAVSSLARRWF